LGTTSYVVDADLVGNAAHLAGRVDDMQLVLFDLPGGPSNLPDAATSRELARIGRAHALAYTVHLLDDLAPLHPTVDWRTPLDRAADVIARTQPLSPQAYVLHFDGRGLRTGELDLPTWEAGMAQALARLIESVGDPRRLAVENLEGYAPDLVVKVAAQARICRCVDVGHLWLDGLDPQPYLAQAAPHTAVIHLHGVADGETGRRQDHVALSHTPPADLDAVLAQLAAQHYTGVLTLEVFGPDDFAASLAALQASLARIGAKYSTWGPQQT
jgi:sugar phosphate isomerase/epimerase